MTSQSMSGDTDRRISSTPTRKTSDTVERTGPESSNVVSSVSKLIYPDGSKLPQPKSDFTPVSIRGVSKTNVEQRARPNTAAISIYPDGSVLTRAKRQDTNGKVSKDKDIKMQQPQTSKLTISPDGGLFTKAKETKVTLPNPRNPDESRPAPISAPILIYQDGSGLSKPKRTYGILSGLSRLNSATSNGRMIEDRINDDGAKVLPKAISKTRVEPPAGLNHPLSAKGQAKATQISSYPNGNGAMIKPRSKVKVKTEPALGAQQSNQILKHPTTPLRSIYPEGCEALCIPKPKNMIPPSSCQINLSKPPTSKDKGVEGNINPDGNLVLQRATVKTAEPTPNVPKMPSSQSKNGE